jgi:ubiquinone/menaquinone biosynthesis C-methylase UbiE
VGKAERSQAARISQPDAARLYDRLAKVYDLWGALTETRARNRALELAAVRDGQQVLEVAVGTGLAFVEIVRNNPSGRNVGIDISPGMLAKARTRLSKSGCTNFALSVASAYDIPEADGSFDTVLNNYMFDLLDEQGWTRALTEFHRVLKPGGKLVLANMTRGERTGSGFYESLYRLSPALMGGCRGVQLSGALRDHGFAVASREYYQQMLFPSEVILATRISD